MANEYVYQPLPDKESVRVLVLAPGKGDEPLSGVLKVIHLRSHLRDNISLLWDRIWHRTHWITKLRRWKASFPYEAISYVWGSHEKSHTILLNGEAHRITANLSDALHQCRFQDQCRVLWADQICIDQNNLEEKNHQVYMMSRIYASSQRTLICLGTDPEHRDHARDAFGVLSAAHKMIQETYQSPNFSWELDSFPWLLPDDPLISDSRWQSVVMLASNPWFSRGWVLQEAALARETRILWAGYESSLLAMVRVEMWYDRRVRNLKGKASQINIEWRTSALLLSWMFYDRAEEIKVYVASESQLDGQDILLAYHYTRYLGFSNPRDRIYAFMGLPFVSNPMSTLPDYNQSHLELYQDFAIKYLEETLDLSLLCYVTYGEKNGKSLEDNLGSSWIPRWDREACTAIPALSNAKRFGQTSIESDDFMILRGENGAPASLQVRGVIFDYIRLLSQPLRKSMTVKDLIAIRSQWPGKAKPSSSHDTLMFLSAFSCGKWHGTTYEEWVASLKSYSELLEESATDRGSPERSDTSPDIQFCHETLFGNSDGLHIFELKRGYYGVGSWAIKQDDVCAFVLGVSDPLILRKVPEAGAHHYRVIGPAYVVGKCVDEQGRHPGLNEWEEWKSWDGLCEAEGWTDWGLKEEEIILI